MIYCVVSYYVIFHMSLSQIVTLLTQDVIWTLIQRFFERYGHRNDVVCLFPGKEYCKILFSVL